MSLRAKSKGRLLTVFIIVFGGAGALGGAYSIRRTLLRSQALHAKELGYAAAKAENYEAALPLLGKYLARFPDDLDALYYYSLSRENVPEPNNANVMDAIELWRRLLDRAPENIDARRHLVELYVAVGFKTETLDAADALLARVHDDAAALHAKAIAQLRLRHFDEAFATIERCNELHPEILDNQILEIAIRSAKGDAPAAIVRAVQELRSRHASDPRFDLLVSIAEANANNPRSAATAARAAAAYPATDLGTVTQIVRQLDALSLFPEALAAARAASIQHPDDMSYRRFAANRLFLSGDYAQLSDLLKNVDVHSAGGDAQLLVFRGLSLLFQNRIQEATAFFDAVSHLREPAAVALAAAARTITMDASDSTEAVDACTKALARDSSNPIILYFLGQAYAREGDGDHALRAWQGSCQSAPEWAVPLTAIAGAMLNAGEFQQAYEVASAAQIRAPDDEQTLLTLASSWSSAIDPTQSKDVAHLLELLSRLESRFPTEEQLRPIHVNLLERLGRPGDAAKLIRDTLAQSPALSEPTLLQLATASQTHKLGLAQDCFDTSERAHGMTPTLAYAKAIYLAQSDRAREGLSFLESLIPKRAPSAEWQLAHARYLDLLNDARAPNVWSALARSFPNDLQVQWAALSSPALQSDHSLLGQVIDRIQARVGDQDLRARLARARWLLQGNPSEKDTSEASVLFSDITRADPNLVEPRLLLAHCMQELGNISGAVDQLRSAAASHPDVNLIALELARLLIVHGEAENARAELDRATQNGLTPADRQQAAILYAGIGDYDRAASLLQSETGTTRGALMLATLYMKQHQTAKVDALCKKLMQTPTPESIQFYAAFLVSQGRQAEAQRVLAKLDTVIAAPGRRELARAGYLARFGTVEQATEQYLAATRLAPADAMAWHQLLVLRLSAGKIDDILPIIANAHHALPNDAAINALNDQISFIPVASDPDGRSLLMSLILTPKDASAISEGLQLLQDMEGKKLSTQDFLTKARELADLHPRVFAIQGMAIHYLAAARQFDDAATLAVRATQVFPESSEAAQFASASLASAGRWAEALSASLHWRAGLEGPTLQADLIIAEAQMQTGRVSDGLQTLQPYIQHALKVPDENPTVIGLYAQGLIMTGKIDAAAQLLQPLLSSPAWYATYVQLAAGLLDERNAAAWLNHAAAVLPLAAQEKTQLAVGYHQLGVKTHNAGYEQTALAILEPLAANPDCDSQTLTVLGSMYESGKNLPEAEKCYRRALLAKPDQPLVLNNLAMVLVHQNTHIEEALEDVTRAAQLAPAIPNFYDTEATVLASAKSYDLAIASIGKAIKLSPADPEWKATRIWLLAISGQQKNAVSEYQQLQIAENLSKLSEDARQRLADVGLK